MNPIYKIVFSGLDVSKSSRNCFGNEIREHLSTGMEFMTFGNGFVVHGVLDFK